MKTEQLMPVLISPDSTIVEAMQHIDRNAVNPQSTIYYAHEKL